MKKTFLSAVSAMMCLILTIVPVSASFELDGFESVEGDISSYVQVEEVTFGEPEPIAEPLNEEELYRLEWAGDFFAAEPEMDEVQPIAALPDLFVTKLEIQAGGFNSPYPAGYPMNYSLIIGNYGTSDASGVEIIVKLDGKTATDPLLVGDIPAGRAGNIQFKAPGMPAGSHTMEIVVNPDKKITESNYSNNTTSSTFTYEARVELVAVSMETEDEKNQYYMDEPVTFVMTFGNAGPIASTNTEIALFGTFKTEDGRYVSSQMGETMTILNLEPSHQISAKVVLRFVKPTEDAKVEFILDPNNKIKEFDKYNNSAQKEFSVSGYVYKLSGGFFDTSNITYNIEGISDTFYLNEIDKALEMWYSRTSDFSIDKTTGEANVNIQLQHYGNVIWTASSTVYGDWSGRYNKSLIKINQDKCLNYGKEYLRPMVAHEMGHLLGLDHVLDKRCIMYAKETDPTEGVQDAAKVNPYLLERVAEDDIKGAEAAYRNNLNRQSDSNDYTRSMTKLAYTEQFSDLESLMKESDVIVAAEITGVDEVELGGIVFTDYEVDIKHLLKNNRNYDLSDMEIRLTGGKTQTNETNVMETPILKVGKYYLFAGDKVFSNDDSKKEFTPSGAYQGVFELESTTETYSRKNNDYKICLMNPYNAVERGAEGTLISDVESLIAGTKKSEQKINGWTEEEYDRRAKISYIVPFNTFEEMLKEASLAVVAEVTDCYKDDSDNSIVFTHYPVEVKKVMKNRNQSDLKGIDFIFTGGKTDRAKYIVVETPMLEKGKRYLFITGDEDGKSKTHGIAGGYRGIFELEEEKGSGEYTIVKMNQYNKSYEEELEGTTISEIEKILAGIELLS